MIKYSPNVAKISKYNVDHKIGTSNTSRWVRSNTPYISTVYASSGRFAYPIYGAWYVFLSNNTIEEIEPMVASSNYSFEAMKSHGSTFAQFSYGESGFSEFVSHDVNGNVTLNIAMMMSNSAKIRNSHISNGGIFIAPSAITVKTLGINFVGGTSTPTAVERHSDNYFLFTVGDKDSDAEVKIHNPVLQAGDTVDLSDLTLTIQIPTTVE
jgi:hypothetical protein